MPSVSDKKLKYRKYLEELLETYKNVLVVGIDNVGSNQMQQIRIALRGRAVLLMGKNTIIRKVIRELGSAKLDKLKDCMYGNVGMVFTNEDLAEVRKVILDNKVPAAARSGALAPIDVFVEPGSTGLDPGQTAFFQVLNIATRIQRGAIEIVSRVHLVKAGEKVTPSHVSLLSKLNIRPFYYAMTVQYVYEDGAVYEASVLDLDDAQLLGMFFNAVRKLTCISLAIGVPNLATIPHSFARAFKKLLAIAVETEITFKEAEKFKEYLADPAAYAAKHGLAVGGSGSSAAASSGAAPAAAKEAEPEEEEESEADMGFNLFD